MNVTCGINSATRVYFFFISLVLILICAFKPVGIDFDSINYFDSIRSISLYGNGERSSEPTFNLIIYFGNSLVKEIESITVVVFFVYASLGIILKTHYIRKYAHYPFTSLIAYIGMFFLFQDFTQIRLGVAVGFLLYAVEYYCNYSRKKAFLFVVLASLFHYSAICFLLLFIFNSSNLNKKVVVFLPIICFFLSYLSNQIFQLIQFITYFLPVDASNKMSMYTGRIEEDGFSNVNKLNIFILVNYFVLIFTTINVEKFKVIDHRLLIWLKLLSVSISSYWLFSNMPIFAFRISELFNIFIIFIIPLVLFYQKDDVNKCLRFLSLSVYVSIYFYYLVSVRGMVNFGVL